MQNASGVLMETLPPAQRSSRGYRQLSCSVSNDVYEHVP
ncbi:hypothetical protein C4K13_2194 [Pseudomonas chlororaphis subsp. aureofaciens]|nr:hypothetical protein C4K13_2194 [Pseudomonas chlororaphis subsp. aureofaciens]